MQERASTPTGPDGDAPPAARYAVVTPARNEEHNLPRLAAALARQTLPPTSWIVIDDGSIDATGAVLTELAKRYPWMRAIDGEKEQGAGLEAGRREGRDLVGFRAGIRALPAQVDVVIKMDADIDFDADYCHRLVGRFAADPLLGIASGTCQERENGVWTRRTKTAMSVWGASRAYRWSCVDEIVFALEPRMGWDCVDELNVQLRGMRTATFADLPFRHHRPEGGREHSSLHQGSVLGRVSWYLGYRPSYLALRALYRAPRQPTAVAMLWGYVAAAVERQPQCPDQAAIGLLREQQRLRVAMRRGLPS